MKEHYFKKHNYKLFYSGNMLYPLLFIATMFTWVGCSKGVAPTALDTSPTGKLSRYDLTLNDYDVLPVIAFTVSYNQANQITDLFEKSGQTLFSYHLNYNGNSLFRTLGSDLSTQTVTYNSSGKPSRIDYKGPTDTGKLVLTYDVSGKLVALLDSVQTPDALPVRYQYLFTYDASGNNVVLITKNQVDLQGRPTVRQYSYYTFDNSPNPFTAFPYLQSSINLPGGFPALINKNNITSSHFVGTILNTSSGGSVPTLDTITIYSTSRIYQYNAKGFPLKAVEKFNDTQFNYSGNRTFTYEY
jgi:hypothetical protein